MLLACMLSRAPKRSRSIDGRVQSMNRAVPSGHPGCALPLVTVEEAPIRAYDLLTTLLVNNAGYLLGRHVLAIFLSAVFEGAVAADGEAMESSIADTCATEARVLSYSHGGPHRRVA